MPCAGANGFDGTRCMSDEPIAKVVVPAMSDALMAGALLRAMTPNNGESLRRFFARMIDA